MKFSVTAKILGILLMMFSLSMLTPILVSLYFANHDSLPFVDAFVITFVSGFVLWTIFGRTHGELRTRDSFLVVFLMWIVLGLFGCLPFVLSYSPHLSYTRAFFETISGLSTTGASTLSQIDGIPESVLYYRQQLQFLGGMGIIVLAVAIMPLIGVGGMQLYKAETTGPMKDNKLTPKITETAKALWLIYVGLTAVCALCYKLAGMSTFDAINYAFATLSTGGFAPHTASISYYPQASIYLISMLFMVLGGTNFSLHFLAFRRFKLRAYWQNSEFKLYIYIILVTGIITSLILDFSNEYQHIGWSSVNGFYQIISFMTTTGFVSDSRFANWPVFLPLLLILVGTLGACAGSTTGGLKVIRALIVQRQIGREVKSLIHPAGIFPVKMNGQVIPDRVLSGIWAFIGAYIGIIILGWLILQATGLDALSAFSAICSCVANIGPGLSKLSNDFHTVSPIGLWVLSIAMLIGRLEVFTVLVLLSPAFWRR